MSAQKDWERLLSERDPYDALFPTGWKWVRLHWREVRSAVGREGLIALVTYAAATCLLVVGVWVSVDTWADREAGLVRPPLADRLWFVKQSPDLNLRLFWIAFLVSFGLVGWWLSRQVTKRSLRIFVALAIVVMTLLLITIGRNGNFESAEANARADARRLLEAEQRTGNDLPESGNSAGGGDRTAEDFPPPLTVGQDVLLTLCFEAGLIEEAPEGAADDEPDRKRCAELRNREGDALKALDEDHSLDADEVRAIWNRRPLSCIEGWTVGAFDRWMQAASFDRRVVALTALASCEIGAPDPSAETADGSVAEAVSGVPATISENESKTQEPTTSTVPHDDVGEDSENGEGSELDAATSAAATSAVLEALRTQRSEVQAYEAIALGADEVLSFASGPAHFAEFRFSGLAWLVLLGLVFFWYRHLEIRSGERRLGPVDVQFESVDGSGSGATDELRRRPATPTEALFKESVIRNVPEPGAVPGSGALAPVGDLVAEVDLPQGRLANGVIDLLQTVFATRGGFTVTCSIRREEPRCAVFVRLRDTRTGNHIISQVFEDELPDNAARLAGYWIAGYIISRSAYVPSWATWSEDNAASFVQTGWVQGDGLSLIISEAVRPREEIRTVNSLLLAQRAYTHQIGLTQGPDDSPDHLAALEDFARAVNRQPRYPVARYRRGVVLGTMMMLPGNLASARGQESSKQLTTSRLRYLFGDLILSEYSAKERDELESACDRLWRGEAFPETMRHRMLIRVAEWSTQNRAALTWRWLARLRPSERFFWKSFSSGSLENDWTRVLDLERCIAAERLAVFARSVSGVELAPRRGRARKLKKLRAETRKRALEPDSHWQLSYNLACLYAIRLAEAKKPASNTSATNETVTLEVPGETNSVSKDPAAPVVDRAGTPGRFNRLLEWLRHSGPYGSRLEAREPEHDDLQGNRREAWIWLERSIDRPYSAQLVRRWVIADGDLKPLRSDAKEFSEFLSRVPEVKFDEADTTKVTRASRIAAVQGVVSAV